jgi:hypothetical protein
MAKATVKQEPPQPPPETRVVLDLSEEEAAYVAVLVGCLTNPPLPVSDIYGALRHKAGLGSARSASRRELYKRVERDLDERGSTMSYWSWRT